MKLPDAINQILHKHPEREEAYLSLVLETDTVNAGVWTLSPGKKARISDAASERVEQDSWEKRTEACDRAIARLAEKEGRDDFEKVVLGLPSYYLTPEEDIEHGTRAHIKTITEVLELTPIGFVPIHQAIVHMIKQEEGVPPSLILLEVSPVKTMVILYKVGLIVGKVEIANTNAVPELERALKEFKDLEVLPSRILLYGSNPETLESYKRDLLKHPWPTRANFLHYPKIEILSAVTYAGAVSLAGASELTSQVVIPSADIREPDGNVAEVSAETLGFRHEAEKEEKKAMLKETLSRFISGVKVPKIPAIVVPKVGFFMLVSLFLVCCTGLWLAYWVLPKASLTILQVPKILSETTTATVNPTATVADMGSKTVPGRKQEKTVSGEKTIDVIGKKDLGDPARGTVTIYNKLATGRQLKKGTALSAGSLSFTLDADVAIASASESIGSLTFGKGIASITATKLGPQSNVPAGTEFSLKETPVSVMIARNDTPLSGGTSKVVSVVSRADYDALVAELTRDLIAKAKTELAGSVSGKERLIDDTVKTTVSQKKFDAELDQEASRIHGSITVTISGFSYNDEDIASLFAGLLASRVPQGYALRESAAVVKATNVKLQKNGSISLNVEYQGQALPTFDLAAIKSRLAGKPVSRVPEELKTISGVGGIEIGKMGWSVWGEKLPANAKNITISLAVLE